MSVCILKIKSTVLTEGAPWYAPRFVGRGPEYGIFGSDLLVRREIVSIVNF